MLTHKAEAIFGEVDSAGRVLRGGGYGVDRAGGAGAYVLKFRLPFTEKPVIIVTAQVRARRSHPHVAPARSVAEAAAVAPGTLAFAEERCMPRSPSPCTASPSSRARPDYPTLPPPFSPATNLRSPLPRPPRFRRVTAYATRLHTRFSSTLRLCAACPTC